jgi:hypothetical protein
MLRLLRAAPRREPRLTGGALRSWRKLLSAGARRAARLRPHAPR